jgi:hypothetical protein
LKQDFESGLEMDKDANALRIAEALFALSGVFGKPINELEIYR